MQFQIIRFITTFRIILTVLFLFWTTIALSQFSQSKDYQTQLANILDAKPTAYGTIDSLLKPFKNDTLKMKDFVFKAKSANYMEGESYALNSVGIAYRDFSLYEKALQAHKRATDLAKNSNNLELEVHSYNMIGVVYRRMDLVKPALDYHKKALDLAKSAENLSKQLKHSIAVSQNSMGNIYLTLKQYDLAITQFEKSLVIEKEANNRLGLAINYQNLGYADEAKGMLDVALRNYQRSLDYNDQIDSEVGRVICYNSIGQVYIKQAKYSDARYIIEKALGKALNLNDQFYIALSYINLGWAEMEMDLFDEAEKNLKKGLQTAEDYNLKSSIVEANRHLSELYQKQGKHQMALNHFQDAVELENTIQTDRNMQYVSDIIIKYENEEKNNEIKALASENELVKSKLERNQKLFWLTLLALMVIAGIVIVLFRNRQLNQEKQILTLEQDMLRSQMNPHFIFNSLNSIKLYIINNEKENAVYYLNKFSKLIRKILVASTEKVITLEEELDTMKLYMNIENIRFSNEIHFHIDVEKDIKADNIKVPSLILQPFLENALWHGLSSKEKDKQIHLEVKQPNENFVSISITDNGIGRKESAIINKSKILKRKSVGISITKARLANFSRDYARDYNLEIQDLYDGEKAIGTKVILNIPIRANVLKSA